MKLKLAFLAAVLALLIGGIVFVQTAPSVLAQAPPGVLLGPTSAALTGTDSNAHLIAITLGTNLSLAGTTLNASGGGGATGFKLESMQFPAVTVGNTATETTLATYTLSANELGATQQLESVTDGFWKTDSTPTNLIIRFKVGGTTVFQSTQAGFGSTTGDVPWSTRVVCMANAAPGASVAVDCQGLAAFGLTNTAGTGTIGGKGNTSNFTLATNGTLAVTITAQWTGPDAASSITATQFRSIRYN